jgi:hypothetical protein
LMTKGEKLQQRYVNTPRERFNIMRRWVWVWTWRWTKREQHWRNEKDQTFLDKESTQVGGASSWTLIDYIWYVHNSCACLHCISS